MTPLSPSLTSLLSVRLPPSPSLCLSLPSHTGDLSLSLSGTCLLGMLRCLHLLHHQVPRMEALCHRHRRGGPVLHHDHSHHALEKAIPVCISLSLLPFCLLIESFLWMDLGRRAINTTTTTMTRPQIVSSTTRFYLPSLPLPSLLCAAVTSPRR
jgi:hypothetical protein